MMSGHLWGYGFSVRQFQRYGTRRRTQDIS
jgi:hypothetical protein